MQLYRNFLNLLSSENGGKVDKLTALSYLSPFLKADNQEEPILELDKVLPVPKAFSRSRLPELPRIPSRHAFENYEKARTKVEEENLLDFGARTEEEWVKKNWGTVSGRLHLKIHERLGEVVFEFITHENPPTPLVSALARKTGKAWGLAFEGPIIQKS